MPYHPADTATVVVTSKESTVDSLFGATIIVSESKETKEEILDGIVEDLGKFGCGGRCDSVIIREDKTTY